VTEIRNEIEKIAAESQVEITALQNKADEQEKELALLKTEKEQLKSSLHQVQDQQKTSDKLQGELKTKEKEIAELKKNLTEAKTNAERLGQEVTDLETQIKNDSEKEGLKKELEGKKGQLEEAKTNVKTLEKKRNDLDGEVSRLQAALIEKNNAEGSKITELKNQLVSKDKEIEQKKTDILRLKDELRVEDDKVKKLESDKAQLEKEKDDQKQSLTKKTIDSEKEIISLKKQIEKFEKERFEFENGHKEKLEKVQKQLSDLLIGDNPSIKQIITEYLAVADERLKEFQGLVQVAESEQEKGAYRQKQGEWEAKVEQIKQVISNSDQQLIAQIEQK